MSAGETTRCHTGRLLHRILLSVISLLILSIPVAPAAAASTMDQPVTVYYLYRTVRCETCLFIETLADATLRAEFPDEMSSGALVWRPLDMQLPGNGRVVEEFGLRASDLVVARRSAGGKQSWEAIPALWELAADPERLSQNLKDVVVRFLGKKK